eukprot:UN01959
MGLQETAIQTLDTWTPQNVKDKVDDVKQSIESTLDATDEILQRTLDLTEEYTSALSQETALEMLDNMKAGAETKLKSVGQLLPSDQINDLILKTRVQELVGLVSSQREQLYKLQTSVHENLDQDKDGKISVKDLATNVSGITMSVIAFWSNMFSPYYETILSPYRELLKSVTESDSIKSILKKMENVQRLAVKLMPASKLLKAYATTYTDNVQSKIKPLTPYFRNLVTSTAVSELPVKLMKLAISAINVKCTSKKVKNSDGEDSEGEENEVDGNNHEEQENKVIVEEATALFWALIDISFIIELMNMPTVDPVTPKEQSNESENEGKRLKKWMIPKL